MTTANFNQMNESQIAGMMGISVEEYRERNRTPKLSPDAQAIVEINELNRKANEEKNNLSTKGQASAKSQRRGGILRYPLEALTGTTDYLQINIIEYKRQKNRIKKQKEKEQFTKQAKAEKRK